MKLLQNQLWKKGDESLRILELERLTVKYKSTCSFGNAEGTIHQATKKEFCRLIKDAALQAEK
jgi:hypothetical protein